MQFNISNIGIGELERIRLLNSFFVNSEMNFALYDRAKWHWKFYE